ncbi:MAG: tripartite tricarboxylate transporter substrate binding protein, partial [Variibacter sp.]|nr:tripartite tricarboxylate transporter substrate binding protein [Variibacter sp.]
QLRDNPPRHSYASGGVGSAGHVGGAMLLRIVGAEGVVHVPYRTTAAFFPDLISNRVAFAVSTPDTMMSYVKAGQLRPLLIAGPKRLASLPDVPTSAEEGFPDLRVSSWYVVQAPAATPEDIVQLLNREVNAVLTEPEMQAWFSRSESIPMPGYTPEATRQYYEQERVRWEPYVIGSGAVAN